MAIYYTSKTKFRSIKVGWWENHLKQLQAQGIDRYRNGSMDIPI